MKLIIDVDEKLVSDGFERPFTEEERGILIRAIGNGTPYEEKPQGDLISRSALKKAIEQGEGISWNSHGKDDLCVRKKYIDNAPTVDFPDWYKVYEDVKGTFERPQGEWIGNAFNEHHCNRCGHPALWEEEPDGYYEVQSRFCPNCGADMRGGME